MIITKPKILCVDDEPEILKFLEAALIPKGYEVIKSESGEGALERLKGEKIDLVISDVMMPKIDGFEVCKRIKGDQNSRNIPVILITGLTAKQDRVKGIEAGAEDFISKPIDPTELLARIKMLLKTKELHEKRIGELFIEMGFITEQQLQRALKIAREQNIKVGEALYSMGALDKDHIYWVLSNQLNMNYVELSSEMIDRELIGQFPIDLLEQLQCLPLYETTGEVHFAIADPTDKKIVKKVKGLKPGKIVQLHLALPEKISDIINFFKAEFYSKPQIPKVVQSKRRYILPRSPIESQDIPRDLVSVLLSIPQGEKFWLHRTPRDFRLISQKGEKSGILDEYSEEIYSLAKEHLKQKITSQRSGMEIPWFLQEGSSERKGVFRLRQIDCFDGEMIQLDRIPTFSREEFMARHPEATSLLEDLQRLFNEHHRILIGGKEGLFVKQCSYLLLEEADLNDFPPPFFIERGMETYFPKAAQLSAHQIGVMNFLKPFKGMPIPFVFYETESCEIGSDEKNLSEVSSGICKNIVLYIPFESLEEMKKTLSVRQDRREAGFKAIFLSPYQWKLI
jgi:DNA-binding response OmpR family regulator